MNIVHSIRNMPISHIIMVLLFCLSMPLEARKSRTNNYRKKQPPQKTIIKAVATTDTHSFAYYQQKTYEFLGHLNAHNRDRVSIEIMPRHDNHYHSSVGYAAGDAIRLNMESFNRQTHAQNLFTCAHEAAHYACGHTWIRPDQPQRSSLIVEQEADETAARMLCTHGYTWVVKDCVDQLYSHILYGNPHISDGIHPTYAQRHQYLSTIVARNSRAQSNGHQHNNAPGTPEPIITDAKQPRSYEAYLWAALCAGMVALYLKERWYTQAHWLRI